MNFLDELKTAIEYNWPTIKNGFIDQLDEISKFWYLIPLAIGVIILALLIHKAGNKIERLFIGPKKKKKKQ